MKFKLARTLLVCIILAMSSCTSSETKTDNYDLPIDSYDLSLGLDTLKIDISNSLGSYSKYSVQGESLYGFNILRSAYEYIDLENKKSGNAINSKQFFEFSNVPISEIIAIDNSRIAVLDRLNKVYIINEDSIEFYIDLKKYINSDRTIQNFSYGYSFSYHDSTVYYTSTNNSLESIDENTINLHKFSLKDSSISTYQLPILEGMDVNDFRWNYLYLTNSLDNKLIIHFRNYKDIILFDFLSEAVNIVNLDLNLEDIFKYLKPEMKEIEKMVSGGYLYQLIPDSKRSVYYLFSVNPQELLNANGKRNSPIRRDFEINILDKSFTLLSKNNVSGELKNKITPFANFYSNGTLFFEIESSEEDTLRFIEYSFKND
jgi:hypothetical protein